MLSDFINSLSVFYFEGERALCTIMTALGSIFHFILNYLFSIGLIQLSRAGIVLLPWKPSFHTTG